MTPNTVIALACAVTIFFCYRFVVVPYFLSPLSRIPNAHITCPITSSWINRVRASETETKTIFALHATLGSVVRLGPNELSVNSATGLRTIYVGGFPKHEWWHGVFMNYGTENLVSMLANKPHSIQKRMISHIYSKSYLQSSKDLQTISRVMLLDRLLPILQGAAQSEGTLNVLELFHASGMDFTTAYLFGLNQSTNFLLDSSYCQHWLAVYNVSKNQAPANRAGGEIEMWCMQMCEAAAAASYKEKTGSGEAGAPSTAPVVYEQLARGLSQTMHNPKLKTLTIASEMLDHIVAGHETSAITMTYLMYELSLRPELQAELRKELKTLSPPLHYPASSLPQLPSARSIDTLPLLEAVLHETLRVYAATPAPQPRVTPLGGVTIDGYADIPGGVRVSSSAYTLHRNPEVFPEPEKWLPERWLKEKQTEEMRRWFWAFGSGGRMCIGSNFALQVMKLTAAAIYSNWTTKIIDAEGIEQMDAYLAGPRGGKLILQFVEVDRDGDLKG